MIEGRTCLRLTLSCFPVVSGAVTVHDSMLRTVTLVVHDGSIERLSSLAKDEIKKVDLPFVYLNSMEIESDRLCEDKRPLYESLFHELSDFCEDTFYSGVRRKAYGYAKQSL